MGEKTNIIGNSFEELSENEMLEVNGGGYSTVCSSISSAAPVSSGNQAVSSAVPDPSTSGGSGNGNGSVSSVAGRRSHRSFYKRSYRKFYYGC